MHINFLALCSYFGPLILNTLHIGFGSSLLLISHIESVVKSLHFKNTLMENYDFKEIVEEELSVPSNEEMKYCL